MDKRWLLLIALTLGAIIALIAYGPIPQWLDYHNFADQRGMWGIPNFLNVITNVPFFFIGAYGMWRSVKNWSQRPDITARLIPVVLFFGIFIVSFGSGYYHWKPTNATLVWDRLPMTLMFMPLFALIIYDFISKDAGKWAFLISVPLGLFSIWYWNYTESIGAGDLRIYAMVQFFPLVAGPLILWLWPKKVPYLKNIIWLVVYYILAKLFEEFDDEVFNTIFIMSGHSIKHLFGAFALYHASEVVWGWEKSLE
ncbi:MAG: ceramidase domain-containing protein [Bacteroidota bacterium]